MKIVKEISDTRFEVELEKHDYKCLDVIRVNYPHLKEGGLSLRQ